MTDFPIIFYCGQYFLPMEAVITYLIFVRKILFSKWFYLLKQCSPCYSFFYFFSFIWCFSNFVSIFINLLIWFLYFLKLICWCYLWQGTWFTLLTFSSYTVPTTITINIFRVFTRVHKKSVFESEISLLSFFAFEYKALYMILTFKQRKHKQSASSFLWQVYITKKGCNDKISRVTPLNQHHLVVSVCSLWCMLQSFCLHESTIDHIYFLFLP